MTAIDPLDTLKYVTLRGLDLLEATQDHLMTLDTEVDDATQAWIEQLQAILRSAIATFSPVSLADVGGLGPIHHSNSHRAANRYSDDSPVYVDVPTVVKNVEDGKTYLNETTMRVFPPHPAQGEYQERPPIFPVPNK